MVDAAIAVHREIGPGLLESVYEAVLAHELRQRGLQIKQQFPIAIKYRGIVLDKAFQADLIIDDKIIVELKCVENINNAHKKQLLTYLRLSGRKLGYLLNFSEALMKHGITRTVNSLIEQQNNLAHSAPLRKQ